MDTRTREDLLNEIRQLRIMLRGTDARISENNKQIKRLQGDKAWLQQLETEYRKEIKQLRADAVHDAEELDKKSNKISKLQKAYNEINGAFWSSLRSQRKKDNEIKDLRHDYDNRQAIITEMRNGINELKAKVYRLEKVNDSRRFHNATEALGNPEYFQEVS